MVEGRAELVGEGTWHWLEKIVGKYVTSRLGKKEGERVLDSWKGETDRVVFVVRPSRILSWNYGRGDLQKQDQGISMATRF